MSANIDINHLEVYADAMEGILLGHPNSKLRFTVVDSWNQPNEPKQNLCLVLTIPTVVMIQACQQVLNSVNSGKDQFINGANEYAKHCASVLGESVAGTKPAQPTK